MKKKLAEIEIQYDKNLNEENTSFEYTREQLSGLPDNWFNDSRLVGDKYRITLKYPDYIPAIKYVKDDAVRKELYIYIIYIKYFNMDIRVELLKDFLNADPDDIYFLIDKGLEIEK